MIAFNFRGHIVFGFLTAAALFSFVRFSAFELGLLLFGSLLPDVDLRSSTLGRFNLMNRSKFFKHRGKCHTLIGSLLLSAPFFLFGGIRGLLFVFIGAVSHLCADKLNSVRKGKKPFTIRLW